jgi:sugar phosphate isomerase/epimerase
MKARLGIDLGFAVNRFPEPREWARIVAEDLGLSHVQFVAELLDPFLPEYFRKAQLAEIRKHTAQYGVGVDSVFTLTRTNHLMHPDPAGRALWRKWLGDLLAMGRELGAKSGGSFFGIMTVADHADPARREIRVKEAVEGWQELSFLAKELGYECLIFEPMSVPREMGCTIEEVLSLLERVNARCGVPMRLNLDVGHAAHPSQRDPYEWLARLGSHASVVHLQQTERDRSHHWPFTPEYNAKGIIEPQRVLETLEKAGAGEVLLAFEIGHREHWDTEFRVIEDLKASAEYWRRWVKG